MFGGFGQQPPAQPAFGGGFGSTPAFGAAPTTPAFGQPQQTQGFGGFGAPANSAFQSAPAFGQSAPAAPSFGFGAAAPASSGFSFGGTANTGFGAPTTSAVPTSNLFGAKPATTFGGSFGTPAAGGMFGAPAVQAAGQGTANPPFQTTSEKDVGSTTTSVYQSISCMPAYKNYSFEELRLQDYEANRKHPTAPTSSFGGGFGTAPASNMFGSAPAATGFGAPATSIFGGAATSAFGQPAAAPAGGMFGQPATPAAPLFGGFGQPAAPAFGQAQPAGGLFGSAKPASSFSFAQPAQPAAGGLFGQPAQNTFGQPAAAASPFGQPAAPASGLFGQPAAPAAGGFSFGAPKPAGGLFGAAPAASPFGAPAADKPSFSFGQPAAPAGGLFGAAQPAVGAFGAPAAAPQTSLFGAGFGQPAATNSFGAGGLFGAKPAAPAGGLFGAPAAAPLGGGLFGQPAQPQQPQPSLFGGLGTTFGAGASTLGQQPLQQPPRQQLYASVDENAYGSNPLFANMGVAAPPIASIDKKKQPSLANAFRSTPRSSTKITRLRGFGNSSASPGMASPSNGFNGTPGPAVRGSPLHILNGNSEEGGFMVRPSVKKLVIEQRRPGGEDLSRSRFGRLEESVSASKGKAVEGPLSSALLNGNRVKVTFTQAEPVASTSKAKEPDSFGSSTPVKKAAVPVTIEKSTTIEKSRRSTPVVKPVHGDYFTLPALSTLLKLPASALQALPDLKVGRVGFGEVSFNAPVDLTTLNSVEDLLGNIVVIEDRNCTVYPIDYEDKPPLGQGLNVPATITLFRCFPLDKATREPIKDKNSSKLISHIKRLRNLEGTQFIDFNVESGSWVFSVDGF